MTARLDKHGRVIEIGDRVRLPSQQTGCVRGFSCSAGLERALVQYDLSELDAVSLSPHLLERLHHQNVRSHRKPRQSVATAHGRQRGQKHFRAQLTDSEVLEMRKLHRRAKKGYGILALIFQCGVSTARDICTMRTRQGAH